MPSSGEGSFQTGISGHQTKVSEGLKILQESAATYYTPVPPSQPPYPECELQEWKTGARGGHHWGNWESQGKGQDPEALVTETRSEPVRLLLFPSDTHSARLQPAHPLEPQSPELQPPTLLWGREGLTMQDVLSFICSKTIY